MNVTDFVVYGVLFLLFGLFAMLARVGYYQRNRQLHPDAPAAPNLFTIYSLQDRVNWARVLFTVQAEPQLERSRCIALGLTAFAIGWLFGGLIVVWSLRVTLAYLWSSL